MEDEGNRQVSQKLKALEQSQKQLTTIIIRGAHDNCSHNPKCLMGLRPAGMRGPSPCCAGADEFMPMLEGAWLGIGMRGLGGLGAGVMN